MPRPGFVLEVDRSTPPILFHHGDRLRLERLPVGRSRVVYPAEPVAPLAAPGAAIAEALARPLGEIAPLEELLGSARRLTVAVDGGSVPVPPMRRPDARQLAVEAVLELAARAGIDDVALVVARGLGRRSTEAELRHVVGDRVYESFAPHDQLVAHDADDPDGLVALTDGAGAEVVLNARAASSDVVVTVGIASPAGVGGRGGPLVGLCGAQTLRARRGIDADADRTTLELQAADALERAGVAVLQVELTHDDDVYGADGPLGVLQRREWEWSRRDRLAFAGLQRGLDLLPATARQRTVSTWRSPLRLTSVHAGTTAAVRAATDAQLDRQHLVPVDGQADVVTLGLPGHCAHDIGSVTDPLLVAWLGLGRLLGLHRGRPLVREGGVVVLSHPNRPDFDPVQRPSSIDLFEQVLPDVADPTSVAGAAAVAAHEAAYAQDEWYRHLYRTAHAEHGVAPLQRWYEVARARAGLGRVVVVGGHAPTVRRLGLQPASTLEDAFEVASDVVGREPTIAHLRVPPTLVADVG